MIPIPMTLFAAANDDAAAGVVLALLFVAGVVGLHMYEVGRKAAREEAARLHRHNERVVTSHTRRYEIEEVYKVKRQIPLPAPQQPPQALPQPPQEPRYLPPPRQRPDEIVDAEFEERGVPRLPAPARPLPPAPWKGGRRDA